MTSTPTANSSDATAVTGERADILELLQTRRAFLRRTVDGITDERAASRPTVSE